MWQVKMGIVLLICLALAIIVIVAGRKLARIAAFRGREKIDLAQMYVQHVSQHGISYESYERVFEELGRGYRVDPRLVRLDDELKKLFDLDSWDLGMGSESFEKWLVTTYSLPDSYSLPKTVLDLLLLVENSSRRHQQ